MGRRALRTGDLVKPRGIYLATLWRYASLPIADASDIVGSLKLGMIVGLNKCNMPNGRSMMEACILDSVLGIYGWINLKFIVKVE